MTGPLTVGDCVSVLKSLADKGASIIDYMRKAGKFDDATVNEITYRVGDAVRKAGALLEEIAPGQGARADITSATGRRSYDDTLNEAKMAERTARDWRAASKLGTEPYGKYLAKPPPHVLRNHEGLGRAGAIRNAVMELERKEADDCLSSPGLYHGP